MRGFAMLALLIVSVFGWLAQRAEAGRFTRAMVPVVEELEERDAELESAFDRRSKRLRDALAKVLRELRRGTRSLSADLASAERAARALRASIGPDAKVDALLERAAHSYLTRLAAEASSVRRVLGVRATERSTTVVRRLDDADEVLARAAAETDPLSLFAVARDADVALRGPRKAAARALPRASHGRALGAGESFAVAVGGSALRTERLETSVLLGEHVTLTFKARRDADVEFIALTFPYSPPLNRAHVVAPSDPSYAVSHGLMSEPDDVLHGTGTITFDVADGDLGNYGGTFDVTFGETHATGAFRVSGVS